MSETSSGWFYLPQPGDTPKGPVSFGDLQQLARSRAIVGKSLVCNQASRRWVEADVVPDLIPVIPFGETDVKHLEAIRLRKLAAWRRRIGWGAVGAALIQACLTIAGDRIDKVALSMVVVPLMLVQLVLALGTSDHLKKSSLPLIVLSGLPGFGAIGLFLVWRRARAELKSQATDSKKSLS
jgi:hypothetical protein